MLSMAVALLNPRKWLEKTINAKGQVPFKKKLNKSYFSFAWHVGNQSWNLLRNKECRLIFTCTLTGPFCVCRYVYYSDCRFLPMWPWMVNYPWGRTRLFSFASIAEWLEPCAGWWFLLLIPVFHKYRIFVKVFSDYSVLSDLSCINWLSPVASASGGYHKWGNKLRI